MAEQKILKWRFYGVVENGKIMLSVARNDFTRNIKRCSVKNHPRKRIRNR
jgi:hypothetical protein